MKPNELIKQVLLQMYQNCRAETNKLDRLDKRVIGAIRREGENDEKCRTCTDSESSAVGG